MPLNESRSSDNFLGLSSDVVDVLLVLLHPGDIISQGTEFISGSGSVISQVSGKLLPVGGVLVDTKLQVLAELLVELLEVVLVLRQLLNQLKNLLDKILPDDLENLVLLEHFSGDIERKILRINNTLDKVEVLWDELLAVVHDEDSSNVQFDVVLALLVLEEIEGSPLGDEKKSSELQLTLDRKMFHSQMLLPIIGQRFIKFSVLLAGNVIRSSGPNWFGLVQLFILGVLLLDFLLFLLVFVIFVSLIIAAHILNLWFIFLLFLLSFLLLFISLIVADFLLALLLDQESDGVTNELGVLLDDEADEGAREGSQR